MNIKSRINARKVVLAYFYEKLFVGVFGQKQNIFDEVFKIEKEINYKESSDLEKTQMQDAMLGYYNIDDREEDVEYIISRLFAKESENGIDFDYIKDIITNYPAFEKQVPEEVNKASVSFKFEEMDLIDRVVFYIGYIEYKKLGTDRSVVLNEMVELAKRYGDSGSAKLVNGVLHNILN